MTTTANQQSKVITHLLNGTNTTMKSIIPVAQNVSKPQLLTEPPIVEYGVLIGITGDIKGKIMLSGDPAVFSGIGGVMFGMAVEGEMLVSFSGELGNMIAGGIATIIVNEGLTTDITAPTVLQGTTKISGYKKAIKLKAGFENLGELDVMFLLDS
ncbi:chemotaxis protein CheX [Oceanobacillus picturae]|uniref:chemotaxis protein CheX n=1 Tax=Oceanobacillus picturae TaxID=171693 RepID=UPI000E6A0E06|nr:chemotaxis protein CheX [Oceanobacillus picturae]RIU94457.1 chemotaxis protein CheX [Oceanobacillus picturae]